MFFKTVSGISLLAFVALYLLQLFPYTGIFLMIVGGPLLTGLLVHVFLIAMVVESLLLRIPRGLIIIPICAYGGYYAIYALQTLEISRTSAQLRSANPGKLFDFDPDKHSLVTANAQGFVSTHAIPVAYEVNAQIKPERYLSFRLMPRDQCNIRDSQNRFQQWGFPNAWTGPRKPCLLRYSQAPEHQEIVVEKSAEKPGWTRKNVGARNKPEIAIETHRLIVDGRPLGVYKTASIERLPRLPFLIIGCALNSGAPKWQCFASFWRMRTAIDTTPADVDRRRFDSPESVLLGIARYSATELADFKPYAQNDALYAILTEGTKGFEDRMFIMLKELAGGGMPDLPAGFASVPWSRPEQLRPFAEGMAYRFVELSTMSIPRSDAKWELAARGRAGLANALKLLPDDVFAQTALPLRVYYAEETDIYNDREIVARAVKLSRPTPPGFYEAELANAPAYRQALAAVAICRIGKTTATAIDGMKSLLLRQTSAAGPNDDLKTALIVTLLKLGEGKFVADNRPQLSANALPNFDEWLDAVLAGEGMTDLGPNNCMTRNWNAFRAHKPSLEFRGGKWVVVRS